MLTQFHTIFQTLTFAILGLGAATGLLIHDTGIDKALLTSNHTHLEAGTGKIGADPHTHTGRTVLVNLGASEYRLQPQRYGHKAAGGESESGRHYFDDAMLPLVV